MGSSGEVTAGRRAATAEELRSLHAIGRGTPAVRTWAALLVGACAAAVVASVAGGSRAGPTATGVLVGAAVLGSLLLVGFTVVFVRRIRASSRARAILAVADPALSPVVPIGEGDRLGGWVVLEATAERLHVARAQSLTAFRLSRAGALVGGLALLATLGAAVATRVTSSTFRAVDLKLAAGMVAGMIWCARFALVRSAYQWTLEDQGGERALEMQDAALFGASRLLTVTGGKVRGFGATAQEIVVHLSDGSSRPLAGLGGTALATWRASCVATTVGVMLGIRTTLRCEDAAKRVSDVPVPAELSDEDLSASTAWAPSDRR